MSNYKFTCVFLMLLLSLNVTAQIPEGVPKPHNNSPLDLSNPADIIIYILIPVLFTVLYVAGRKLKRR